jgi:hypothetical protein
VSHQDALQLVLNALQASRLKRSAARPFPHARLHADTTRPGFPGLVAQRNVLLALHRQEELVVGLGDLELVDEELDGGDLVHRV